MATPPSSEEVVGCGPRDGDLAEPDFENFPLLGMRASTAAVLRLSGVVSTLGPNTCSWLSRYLQPRYYVDATALRSDPSPEASCCPRFVTVPAPQTKDWALIMKADRRHLGYDGGLPGY